MVYFGGAGVGAAGATLGAAFAPTALGFVIAAIFRAIGATTVGLAATGADSGRRAGGALVAAKTGAGSTLGGLASDASPLAADSSAAIAGPVTARWASGVEVGLTAIGGVSAARAASLVSGRRSRNQVKV
jgi:hypothetical protein